MPPLKLPHAITGTPAHHHWNPCTPPLQPPHATTPTPTCHYSNPHMPPLQLTPQLEVWRKIKVHLKTHGSTSGDCGHKFSSLMIHYIPYYTYSSWPPCSAFFFALCFLFCCLFFLFCIFCLFFVCLFVCLLCLFCLFVFLSIIIFVFFTFLTFCLFAFLPFCLFAFLSFCLFAFFVFLSPLS